MVSDANFGWIRPVACNKINRLQGAIALCCYVAIVVPSWAKGTEASAPATVQVVNAPAGCFVPDAIMDAKGVLHLVYALNRNAYYIRSTDNGTTFTAPVQVNSEGSVEFKMGERGPKLAVGSDGVIHGVWVDCWSPGVKTFARYSSSHDGGKTFAPLKTVSSVNGVDGVTLTADGSGNVLVFWHVAHPPQKEVPQATWLHLARSADNGATFAPDERIEIGNHSGLACSMCMMRARCDVDGNVYLAFRSAEKSIRDFYVLKAFKGESRFTAIRVNKDQWEQRSCPMCGPELTVGPEGKLLCAFMSRHKIYWAVADHRATDFRLHVATPANEPDEIYPVAIANRREEVLFVWQVGPMSTTARATVHWATYTLDGKFNGKQGTIGTTTSGTKATAFVGTDDNFYIVTTAQKVSTHER
jgi:hypothetical protein